MVPLALLLCGPSMAGKSTLAKQVRESIDAAIVCADDINAERGLPFGAEGLPESVWAETLRIQLERIGEHGANRRNVIVDDTLCYRWLRDRMRQTCIASGLKPLLLVLAPTPEAIRARRSQAQAEGVRPSLSAQRLDDHLRRFEWPAADEPHWDVTGWSSAEVVGLLRRAA